MRILVAGFKWKKTFHVANTEEQLHAAALAILSERVRLKFYDQHLWAREKSKDILSRKSGAEAVMFLRERSDMRHENFYLAQAVDSTRETFRTE